MRSATLAEAAFRDGGDALNIGLAVKLSRGAFLASATVLIKSCYYAWKFVQEVKIHAKAC